MQIAHKFKTNKEALSIVGGLSNPSKMPCKGISTPASACHVGSKLRSIKGSVCYDCYAMKGQYYFPSTQEALQRRLESLDHPLWVLAMSHLLRNDSYFRWHDSGDIQSVKHFQMICLVAYNTPNCKHWIPTREKGILKQYVDNGHKIPPNLTVRLSAAMVDTSKLPDTSGLGSISTSTVHTSALMAIGHTCEAYRTVKVKRGKFHIISPSTLRDNKAAGIKTDTGYCGDCRKCWNPEVKNVSYGIH